MIQGPWQAFYFARGGTPEKNPFKWAYALCVGIEAMVGCFIDMWDKIRTDKKAGLLYSNGTDGQAWLDANTGGPFYFEKGGYASPCRASTSRASEDYTQQISEFKKFGAEICAGAAAPGDFTNFWKPGHPAGLQPQDLHDGPGPQLRRDGERHRSHRRRADHRDQLAPGLPLQELSDRARPARSLPTPTRPTRAHNGRQRSSSTR